MLIVIVKMSIVLCACIVFRVWVWIFLQNFFWNWNFLLLLQKFRWNFLTHNHVLHSVSDHNTTASDSDNEDTFLTSADIEELLGGSTVST